MSACPDRPLLKPWYRIARGEDCIVLEYGDGVVVFEGGAVARLLPALLPLLDGTRTRDEIAASFDAAARPGVDHALGLLADYRLLLDGPALTDKPASVQGTAELLAASSDDDPADVLRVLRSRRVAVVGGGPGAAAVAETLAAGGLGEVVRRGWADASPDHLAVVVPCPAELPLLVGWNERALASGLRWLQVLPFNGRVAVVGPLYVPGETCCYECYRRRRAAVVDYRDELRLLDLVEARYPTTPALDQLAAAIAALVVLRRTWGDDELTGFLYLLELGETVSLTGHVVHRLPRCPVCSRAEGAASPPVPWTDAVIK